LHVIDHSKLIDELSSGCKDQGKSHNVRSQHQVSPTYFCR
jgi:hypothetical protein